tara:strand:+ start:4147 stop:4278 length:132 start_codon:yes stop_codon:yes gene_type:complete
MVAPEMSGAANLAFPVYIRSRLAKKTFHSGVNGLIGSALRNIL